MATKDRIMAEEAEEAEAEPAQRALPPSRKFDSAKDAGGPRVGRKIVWTRQSRSRATLSVAHWTKADHCQTDRATRFKRFTAS